MKACLLGLLLCFAPWPPAGAAEHGVILLYHHVSGDTPASTSVTPATFEEHLRYLEKNDFRVWRPSRLLASLVAGKPVPDNTVAITFDDAYESIYTEAFPRLRRRGWPFAVFVNTEAVDRGYSNALDWEQLREMAAAGVEIGNHSHSHDHLVRRREGESTGEWAKRISADIERARSRLQEELAAVTGGALPELFAYPYGEYDEMLRALVDRLGYVGLAQQSGAVGPGVDTLAVPRFPLGGTFADLERFATSVHTRPLPLLEVDGGEHVRRAGEAAGRLRLTLTVPEGAGFNPDQLACFSARGERLEVQREGDSPVRVVVDLPEFWSAGRAKVNCTAPVAGAPGEYYWYSHQWLVREADGSWYRE